MGEMVQMGVGGGAGGTSAARGVVTWADAEDAMIEAVGFLAVLPDRDAAFLSAGRRSAWPQVLRIGQEDYPDRPDPRERLDRAKMARLDAMLLGERAAALAVPEGQRALVGRVLRAKLWPDAGGFRWSSIWLAEGGRACGVTSDALRRRYERAIGRVAVRMSALGLV